MTVVYVLLTMATCFFSLVGIIVAAKSFGFSPEQFHNPDAVLDPLTNFMALTILIVPILIVLIAQKYIHKRSVSELGLAQVRLKDFFLFMAMAILLKGVATVGAVLYSSESIVSLTMAENLVVRIFFFGIFLFFLILNSLNEEFIYRAYPIENLRNKLTSTLVVLLSAAFFSGMHFVIETPKLSLFLYRFFFGTLAGFIYIRRRTLSSIVGLHTGWNFIALSVSDSHWKLGGLINVTGLLENSETTANIIVLALASVVVAFYNTLQSSLCAKRSNKR